MNEDRSFQEAIASGDWLKSLIALRTLVADKLDAGPCAHCGGPRGEAAGIAALSLRLLKIMDEIQSIPKEGEVSQRDEIAVRRKRRREADAENRDASG